MQELTSRDNPNIKQYVKLSAGKQARKKQGMFAVEGVRLCGEILRSQWEVSYCLFTAQCAEQNSELAEAMQSIATCYQITPELASQISQTDTPQGVFAVCRMPEMPPPKLLSGLERILFLHDLQDPGNLGTIIRTADAFGYEAVVLTPKCCDWYAPKVLRAAMGSTFRIPFYIAEDAIAFSRDMRTAGKVTAAAVAGAADFQAGYCILPEIHVLYIGNEGSGLPAELVQACDYRVTIPMAGSAESLNASVAAAVLLWELSKRRKDG